jgi:Holliday junction resolvasome RuvABC endonuclease subunit
MEEVFDAYMAKTAATRKRQSKLKRAIKALQRLIDQRNKDFEALERQLGLKNNKVGVRHQKFLTSLLTTRKVSFHYE